MKPFKQLSATVFIPVYNGEEFLDDVLKSLKSQVVPFDYEIFVIDSGSTDRSLEIIKKYDVRLHEIPNEEFGHGKTRNLAAQMSKSTFMVYLTQDAVPVNDVWLQYMLEPFFIDDKIAAVLGKQIPRPDCNITVKREVNGVFGNLGPENSIIIHRGNSLVNEKLKTDSPSFLSDVCAAYRREILIDEIPFKEVAYAEDQAIGQEILDHGYLKAYAPLAKVWHSHDFSVREYFYRKYDEYMGLKEGMGIEPHISFKELVLGTIKATVKDYLAISRDRDYSVFKKITQLIRSPGYNLAVRMAIRSVDKSNTKRNKYSLESRQKNKG